LEILDFASLCCFILYELMEKVTGHFATSNGKKITVDSADSNRKKVILQSENVNIVKKNPATAIYTATGWTFLV